MWHERICQALQRGAFTDQDLEDSGQWTSCAIGEWKQRGAEIAMGTIVVTGILHRQKFSDGPINLDLHSLGCRFHFAMRPFEMWGGSPWEVAQIFTDIRDQLAWQQVRPEPLPMPQPVSTPMQDLVTV